jgi:hypothetical protein
MRNGCAEMGEMALRMTPWRTEMAEGCTRDGGGSAEDEKRRPRREEVLLVRREIKTVV